MKPPCELLKHLLLIELEREGFLHAAEDPDTGFIIPDPSTPIIQLTQGGHVYKHENPPQEVRDYAENTIVPIFARTKEMWTEWENGRPMMPHKGDEGYRILAETGECLLAARMNGVRGLHFAVWDYAYGRAAVMQGDYLTDYEAAKHLFARRANLIDKNQIIGPGEARIINEALSYLENDEDAVLSFKEGDIIKQLQAKMENIIQSEQEAGDGPNHETPQDGTAGLDFAGPY